MTICMTGETVNWSAPEWRPLLDLCGERLTGAFMWMFEVELEDGLRVHAYKHRHTRRYLHLGEDGSAWIYLWSDEDTGNASYRPFFADDLLEMVLAEWVRSERASAEDLADYRVALERLRAARSVPLDNAA